MANTFYPQGLRHFGRGEVAWIGDTIRVYPIDTAVEAYDPADEFLAAVIAGVPLVTGNPAFVALAGKDVLTGGILVGGNVSIAGISGTTVEALVVVKWIMSSADSYLLQWWDTTAAGGFSLNPAGGSLGVTWPSGTNRMGKL